MMNTQQKYQVINSIPNRPTRFTLIFLDFEQGKVIETGYFSDQKVAELVAKLLNEHLVRQFQLSQQKEDTDCSAGYDG